MKFGTEVGRKGGKHEEHKALKVERGVQRRRRRIVRLEDHGRDGVLRSAATNTGESLQAADTGALDGRGRSQGKLR